MKAPEFPRFSWRRNHGGKHAASQILTSYGRDFATVDNDGQGWYWSDDKNVFRVDHARNVEDVKTLCVAAIKNRVRRKELVL